MKLTVTERIKLNDILPQKHSFVVKKLIRKFSESLSFNEKEHSDLHFRYEFKCSECGNSVMSPTIIKCGSCNRYMEHTGYIWWNIEGDKEKDIFVGDKIKEIIVNELKILDEQEQLDDTLEVLYEKFIGEEDGNDNDKV